MTKKTSKLFQKYKSKNIDAKTMEKGFKKALMLGTLSKDFLTFLSMLKDSFSGKFYISRLEKAMIIGAVTYVVVPSDVTPDFIPALGFLDDIGVVGYVIKKTSDLLQRYKEFQAGVVYAEVVEEKF